MKITTRDDKQKNPTLRCYLIECETTRQPPVFRMNGSTYCAIKKSDNQSVDYEPSPSTYRCPENFAPCFNLNCHTVRAVNLDSQVQPHWAEIQLKPVRSWQ